MIFLSVGTQFGFDRLVRSVDQAVAQGAVSDVVFAQIGPGTYRPCHMDYVLRLDKDDFDKMFFQCCAVISHAGIGNIALAIQYQKPLLVMPRLKKYGEVVNNHQVDTARKFEELGHLIAAYNEEDLIKKIGYLSSFCPKPRVPNRQRVVERISRFLESI